MRIVIEKVNLLSNPKIVSFSSEFGIADAIWEGEKPEIGKEYYVEIEVEDIINSDVINLVEQEKYSIEMVDEWVYITGFIDSVDDDGYSVLRLKDNIIAIEIEANFPLLNKFVEVKIKEIKLYEVNY